MTVILNYIPCKVYSVEKCLKEYMSFRPARMKVPFSAEHACVVEHGRNSEESDTDEGDEVGRT